MSDTQPPREESHELLRRMLEQPDDEISLARAALVIASSEYPALDPAKYIDRLDRMAANLGGRIQSGRGGVQLGEPRSRMPGREGGERSSGG